MKSAMKVLMALVLVALTSVASAGVTSDLVATRRSRNVDNIKLGRWHENLDACLAYCKENGVPLVAVWSNGDNCGHCVKFENNVMSEPFRNWMPNSGMVFYFGYRDDAYPGGALHPWCKWCGGGTATDKTLPLIRIFWQKKGKTSPKVDHLTDGDTMDAMKGKYTGSKSAVKPNFPDFIKDGNKDYGTYNPGGRYCIYYLTNMVLSAYKPTVPVTYYGGEFSMPDDAQAGLQIEIGSTENISVPFSRTNTTAQANVSTNYLVRIYPDDAGTVKTNDIVWLSGVSSTNISFGAKSTSEGVQPGEKVTMILLDAQKKAVATNHITYVAPVANSPKNPLWIGERAAAPGESIPKLGWGEWTMDLDVVTNRVIKYKATNPGSKAYSMILVGGSLWCPDCALADKNFFERSEFRDWAASNHVALGVIDIPNDPSNVANTPSLLTYGAVRASDAYVTLRYTQPADESMRVQSGASYLSRKGIMPEAAQEIIKRNKRLVGRNTLNGGWNRPERSNQNRTGVPILLLLRDDGTIAARWNYFSDLGPDAWNDNYIKRLDEMLAQIGEEGEESNDNWRTTTDEVVKRGSRSGSLSHVDLNDAYRVASNAVGQVVSFKVEGAADVQATVKIVQVDGTMEKVLASTSGVWTNALDVTAQIPSTNCYLMVAADTLANKPGSPVSAVLAATCAESTVCDYAIRSDNVLMPTEEPQQEVVTDGELKVTITCEANATYKFANVDKEQILEFFNEGVSDDLYVAKESGSVTIPLAEKDPGQETATLTYQLWNTGRIGFALATKLIKETQEEQLYEIKVQRQDGTAGKGKVKIVLDTADSRMAGDIADGSIYVWEQDNTEFVWEDNESDAKSAFVKVMPNEFADGDRQLVFRLVQDSGTSDAGLGIAEFVLTIKDDDTPSAGTLALCETEPACAKTMTVVAPGESQVIVKVGRFGGADGCVTGRVSVTAGSVDVDTLVWQPRLSDERTVTFTLPPYAEDARQVQLVLTADGGAKCDTERKYLTVKLVPADAPKFAQDSLALTSNVFRYIPIAKASVAVDSASVEDDWEGVTVVKYGGSLAPGLEWRYDEETHEVAFEGTPTKAGSYAVSYQVRRGDIVGSVLNVTVEVAEITTTPGQAATAGVNPNVAHARTISDILVSDVTEGQFAGVVTLTIPTSGRLSAKYRTIDGRTVSFLSENWEAIDAEGALSTTLRGSTEETADCSMTVTVKADEAGTVVISDFADSETPGDEYELAVPSNVWTEESPASSWEGYYTVSLPVTNVVSIVQPFASGAGYLTLKMNTAKAVAAGKMSYAGILPNGRAVTGSAKLVAVNWSESLQQWEYALLPIVSVSTSDIFSGLIRVDPDAREKHENLRRSVSDIVEAPLRWQHLESGLEDAEYEVLLGAFGGYYKEEEDFASCCNSTFLTTALTFFAQSDMLTLDDGFARGAPDAWKTNAVAIKVSKTSAGLNKILPADTAMAKSKNGLTFTFNRATGIVSGSLKLKFGAGASSVQATYQGVVMPGWGSAGCTECTLGNAEALLRPFISGTCWFNDVYNYVDAKGRSRTLSVKRSIPFSVGTEIGQ